MKLLKLCLFALLLALVAGPLSAKQDPIQFKPGADPLEERVAQLEAKVKELEARLGVGYQKLPVGAPYARYATVCTGTGCKVVRLPDEESAPTVTAYYAAPVAVYSGRVAFFDRGPVRRAVQALAGRR